MDFINKYVTKGTVTGFLAAAAVIAGFFGQSALGAFFSDPDTAAAILTVLGAGGSLVAGALNGAKKTVSSVETTTTVVKAAD